MRRKIEPETDARRALRTEMQARQRAEDAVTEEQALDAAVRRSIKQHGP
jgi:hypothetical protein